MEIENMRYKLLILKYEYDPEYIITLKKRLIGFKVIKIGYDYMGKVEDKGFSVYKYDYDLLREFMGNIRNIVIIRKTGDYEEVIFHVHEIPKEVYIHMLNFL